MIGDWVFCNGECTVVDITHKETFDIVGLDYTGEYDIFYVKDIKPIPLTQEILESNGFELTEKDDIFRCQDGKIVIEVGIYHPDFINIGFEQTTPDGTNKGEISSICKIDGSDIFVHELQHALRLCGIEKEIVLR